MTPRRLSRLFSSAVLTAALFAATACAADWWTPASDAGVMTNNDCGRINYVEGDARIRRSFQAADAPGNRLNIADRVSSGDVLIAPAASRLEWITGNNTIVTLAPGSSVKLGGLRTFTGPSGLETARLDVTLLSGEIRVQVRLNVARPEGILFDVGGADVLVTKGDVNLFAEGGWRCAALAGEATARVKRGNIVGAPFTINASAAVNMVGSTGESAMKPAEKAAVKTRVPFSFEILKAALPPLPPLTAEMEAP